MRRVIEGLYAIADNTFISQHSCLELAKAYLDGGAKIIQLRMKGAIEKEVLETAKKIVRCKKGSDFVFIMNDWVTVAKEVGADGIHLGANDLPVREARRMVGPKMLIGYSSHSLEEALQAEAAGADYVAFGAIFPTKTKGPGHPVQGIEKLQEVVNALSIPVVAIGGIGRNNFQSVCKTGVASIAMITALTEAKDIAAEVSYYVNFFRNGY